MSDLVESLRADADFIDRDTYDECWEVKETERGKRLREAADAITTLRAALESVDEKALEVAARAIASGRTGAYEDDKIWAEDVEWQRRRQDGGAPFPQARAAISAYLAALKERVKP